ncbi:squalene/phytoene synthase family protein [Arhodomonas sp. AD133]|uniref:squalene/phytoene synthase family protein n=1 Tax=Arhodomonas sp. AD133 TaxID=3415009 RepID=UPI003EB6BDD2
MQPQQYCRDKAAPTGSSLHYALLFAPDEATRADLLAVNALHAELTAIPASVSDPGVAAAKLGWWREEIERALDHQAQHPVTQALAAADARRALDREDIGALLDGVAMDLEYGAYPSFRELSVYCHRVGGATVRLAVAACGGDADECATYAHDLGMALALLRIIRRLRPHLDAGRLYLPEDELAAAGLDREHLLSAPNDATTQRFLDEQAARVEEFLANALVRIPASEHRRLLPITVHAELYRHLLRRLRADGMPVLTRRHHLTPLRKLYRAWRIARRERAADRRNGAHA